MGRVTSAVLPVAGLGTRFLPATKSIPKEMLPVVDKPAIQYCVEECVRAGIDDVVFVTAAGKASMEDHFDRRLDLEQALADKGKHDLLEIVRDLGTMVQVNAIRQGEPLGLGHAVGVARQHVGDDHSFAVLLGDDLIHPDDHFLERMVSIHEDSGRAVVAVMEVPDDQTHLYGVVAAKPTNEDDVYEVTELIEKPAPGTAPSNLIIIGRYVLPGAIFEVIENTAPGRGGEIQLTDALQTLADEQPILAVRYDGNRMDTGDKLGYLKANVQLALEREDLGPDLRAWLVELLDGGRA